MNRQSKRIRKREKKNGQKESFQYWKTCIKTPMMMMIYKPLWHKLESEEKNENHENQRFRTRIL